MAGGSSGVSSSGKKRARIEIIPLIDVIFFLLATFVLFTLSLNRSQGVRVVLPESETGVPRDPSGTGRGRSPLPRASTTSFIPRHAARFAIAGPAVRARPRAAASGRG